jgi:uncharacterized protein YcbK (DUF882 family)
LQLEPEAQFKIRASRHLSRRAALGSIFGSLAAAGGYAILKTPEREIVGPREAVIPSGPSPFGALHPLRAEMGGQAKLVDLTEPGLITPLTGPDSVPAPVVATAPAPIPSMLGPQPPALFPNVVTAGAPTPPQKAAAATPRLFALGQGRYTPSDLAYIDREAPKTDRGFAAVRGLWLVNPHTKEELVTLFWSVGEYDNVAYSACCELMRDWRERQTVAMDPKLMHLLWAIQRTTRFSEPLIITSGFRTDRTNTMLRAEGAAVNSQHLHSRAADVILGSTPPGETARVAQAFGLGGLGLYKKFSHIDTGPRRVWHG